MAETKVQVVRFRKEAFFGGNSANSEPRWHIAKYAYKSGEIYNSMEALCGYTMTMREQMRGLVVVSKAVKAPRGNEECKLCLREQAKRVGGQ